jgi:hypothetical protein
MAGMLRRRPGNQRLPGTHYTALSICLLEDFAPAELMLRRSIPVAKLKLPNQHFMRAAMSTPQCVMGGEPATLHVFVQDGAWHWGISVPRERGCGFQVIAYNERGFATECDAMSDGSLALRCTANMSGDATGAPFPSVAEVRRRYMRERLRCAMARCMRRGELNPGRALGYRMECLDRRATFR